MIFDILPRPVFDFMHKNPKSRRFWHDLYMHRSKNYVKKISPYLEEDESIIDIGAGPCIIAEILSEKHDVEAVDVQDLSFSNRISPKIYDGKELPYDDREFDVALIMGVLHHTPSPKKIIAEAARVAENIIIVEDIYRNAAEKYWTYLWDSLNNLQFFDHPHTNKTDKEWKSLFKKLDLDLVSSKYDRSHTYFFRHATYYLDASD